MLFSGKIRIYTNGYLLALSLSFVMAFASPASAISYFDIGFGVGPTWATLGGYDIGDNTALDFGIRIGGRPIKLGTDRVYIISELNVAIGTYFYDFIDNGSHPYTSIGSFMMGPGVIFYPLQSIQLGSSVGYSAVVYDGGAVVKSGSRNGIAYNISVALDVENIGGIYSWINLMGLKYSVNTDLTYIKSSTISFFLKYVYRKKIVSLAE
jgi:hypothetical protein